MYVHYVSVCVLHIHLGKTTENYSLSVPTWEKTLNSKVMFWVRQSRPFSDAQTQRGKCSECWGNPALWLLILKLELRVPCHSQTVYCAKPLPGTSPSPWSTLKIRVINIRGRKHCLHISRAESHACLERAGKLWAPFPVPYPLHLFHLAVPRCILYNKLGRVSKVKRFPQCCEPG